MLVSCSIPPLSNSEPWPLSHFFSFFYFFFVLSFLGPSIGPPPSASFPVFQNSVSFDFEVVRMGAGYGAALEGAGAPFGGDEHATASLLRRVQSFDAANAAVAASQERLQLLAPDDPRQPRPLLTENFMLKHFKVRNEREAGRSRPALGRVWGRESMVLLFKRTEASATNGAAGYPAASSPVPSGPSRASVPPFPRGRQNGSRASSWSRNN